MRIFLRILFWSHGTLLGYLGSLSQKWHPEIFSKWVLINLSNPLRHPAALVDPLLTKNLDTAGLWCVPFFVSRLYVAAAAPSSGLDGGGYCSLLTKNRWHTVCRKHFSGSSFLIKNEFPLCLFPLLPLSNVGGARSQKLLMQIKQGPWCGFVTIQNDPCFITDRDHMTQNYYHRT